MKNICLALLVTLIGAVTSANINPHHIKILQRQNFLRSHLTNFIEGSNATIKEFNYLGTVHVKVPWFFLYTSAIIINKEWLLTSSEVVDGALPNDLHVRVGSDHAFSGGKKLNVSQIILHPKSTPDNLKYAIALIKLRDPLEFTESVGPVKVAKSQPNIGAHTVVAGLGVSNLLQSGELRLKKADLSILDIEACKNGNETLITDNSICAGSGSKSGPGALFDWGSPLLHNGELIGTYLSIASPNITAPGLFLDVTENSELKKWIDTQVNN